MTQQEQETDRTAAFSAERDILRTELLDLKRCQITYLTVALQATAIAFALAGTLATRSGADPAVLGSIALLPLVITLPAWWVFFDKAVSVTRMASYLRISERCIGGEDVRFIGWERSVERYRQEYADRPGGNPQSRTGLITALWGSLKGLVKSSTSRYWALVYCTFLGASLLCFLVGAFMSEWELGWRAWMILGPAILAFVVTAAFNLNQLTMLVDGPHSYHQAEARWLSIFDLPSDPVTHRA